MAARKDTWPNKKRRRIKRDRVKSKKDPTTVQRYHDHYNEHK